MCNKLFRLNLKVTLHMKIVSSLLTSCILKPALLYFFCGTQSRYLENAFFFFFIKQTHSKATKKGKKVQQKLKNYSPFILFQTFWCQLSTFKSSFFIIIMNNKLYFSLFLTQCYCVASENFFFFFFTFSICVVQKKVISKWTVPNIK